MGVKDQVRFLAPASLAIILLTLTVACGGEESETPASQGLSPDELRSAVQEAVREAVPTQQPPISRDEIQQLVQDAVSSAVPEGTSSEEIRAMVQDAIASSPQAVTRDEVEALIRQAVSDAAASGQSQLTAEEVEQIVSEALAQLPAQAGPSGEPIKIGTLLDYTGDLGLFGPPMRNGADLAAELINNAGGILGRPVSTAHKDSGTSQQIAIEAARALINTEGVEAIVGSLSSGVTLAVANAVTIPNQVVLMSPASTSPALTVVEDNNFLFRTTVSDAAQGVVLADLARELGYNTASTIYVNNAYGEGLARVFEQTFEQEGGTVLAMIPQESGQPSYVSEVGSATLDNPDVLIAMSYPESAGVYLREALEGGFINTFMFVDGTKNQEMFDRLGVENFEGFYGTAPGTPESDASEIFRQLFEQRFGQLPTNPFIGETFDAFVLQALAIEKAGVYDGSAISNALRFVANPPGEKVGPGDLRRAIELIRAGEDIDYEGVAGSQNFDENGDVNNTIEIWKIENGQIVSTGRFESP